jgi:phosphate transport system substrate-binding protein
MTSILKGSAVLAFLSLAACSSGDKAKAGDSGTPASGAAASGGGVDLNGAGATFPMPIYSRWVSDYAAKTGVKINYSSIGSGGGVKQISEQTVDFGASDAPMTDDELAAAKGGALLHIPTVIGVLAITYNVPEVTAPLKLTGPLIADIYLGKITKWNDSRIAAANAGVTLPAKDILVVHRSDGSGTTYVFTDYLSTVSPAWKGGPGRGKDINWPVGLGAKGNEGVAAQVKQSAYAIGYNELAFAKQNQLATALVQNKAGSFVAPSAESGTAAAADIAAKLPANTDFRLSLIDAPGAGAYPITSLTWLLVYRNQPDAAKGKKLVDFIRWALTEGEAQAAPLGYAPLPESVVKPMLARLDSIGSAPK